tara:strand:+ start:57649 stop:58116 length:468 start_codon:yes stop_codon:yes gene_type:complete
MPDIDFSSFVPLPHYRSVLKFGSENKTARIALFNKLELDMVRQIVTYWVEFDSPNAEILSTLFDPEFDTIHNRPAKMKIHTSMPEFTCIIASSGKVLQGGATLMSARGEIVPRFGNTQIRVNLGEQKKLDEFYTVSCVEKKIAVEELTRFDILDI